MIRGILTTAPADNQLMYPGYINNHQCPCISWLPSLQQYLICCIASPIFSYLRFCSWGNIFWAAQPSMTKVQYKPLCIQRCLFEKLSSPLLNGVKGQGRVGCKAAGVAEERLAKAFHTSELAWFGCAMPTRGVVGQAFTVKIFVGEDLPQRDPIRKEVILSLYTLLSVYYH